MMGPNGSFLVLIAGFAGMLLELRRPGLILPGSLGMGAAVAGSYFLWQRSPQPVALALLGVAAVLFAAEMIARTSFLAGIGGTCALATGCCLLLRGTSRINPALAVFLSAGVGFALLYLAQNAKRARSNKRSDL
ncbi:MAG: hypothetical protein M3Y24_09705 [Acidobacteriota bacterium]|nr:hypothetical protein [Acidobacteriota bacterium]